MKVLRVQPTRRRLLRAFGVAAIAAPIVRLARAFRSPPKNVKPEDLPPVPWIGHC